MRVRRGLAPISVGLSMQLIGTSVAVRSPLDFCRALAGGFAGAMKSRGHRWPSCERAGPRALVSGAPRQARSRTKSIPWNSRILRLTAARYGNELSEHGKEPSGGILHWFFATCDSPNGCLISTILWCSKTWRPPDAKNPVTTMRLGERRLTLQSVFLTASEVSAFGTLTSEKER